MEIYFVFVGDAWKLPCKIDINAKEKSRRSRKS